MKNMEKWLKIAIITAAITGMVTLIELVLSIIIGVISAFAITADAAESEIWCVGTASGLNCRAEPNTDADVLTVYPYGTKLQIIGVDNSGEWWETWDGDVQGWCNSSYLVSNINAAPEENMRCIGSFKCTTYTPDPAENGGGNHTACGDVLTDVVGYAIAVDPRVIPYGTKVYIKDIGYRVARDCGGAIKGNRIDVLAWSNTMDALGGYSTHEVYIVE